MLVISLRGYERSFATSVFSLKKVLTDSFRGTFKGIEPKKTSVSVVSCFEIGTS